MSKSIKLHPEHGLNPMLTQCALCAGDKNEIALLGAACKDKAPMRAVIDNEPCDKCKEMMSHGFLLIVVQDNTDRKNPYRTGQQFVVRNEAAEKIFGDISSGAAFIEESFARQLGLYDIEPLEKR